MAEKLVIKEFQGEIPRVPDDDLPPPAASVAINTRLTNGTIRPFPTIESSADANSTLSSLSNSYTNFLKASEEAAINWVSWVQDFKASVLEIRYNDISEYVFPTKPATFAVGGVLNVLYTGQYVILSGTDDWASMRAYGYTGVRYPLNPVTNLTQTITAGVEEELAAITSYAWSYVSGDTGITITDPAVAAGVFNLSGMEYPVGTGASNANVRSAVWRCAITDASGYTGYKDIEVGFSTYWELTGSYGGTYNGGENDYQTYEY